MDALGELPVHGVVTVGPAIPVSTLALARVVATGAGTVIDAQSTAIQIRQAVVAALANPDLRSRAAELMAAIQASTRADLAVHEPEGLAALAPHRP